jgi:NADH-quinone oxidoreductase subunit N
MLYGIALMYGAAGTTKLADLPQHLTIAMSLRPGLVYTATGLLAAGFAFKVAAVPFHMWTPDVYEGAPTPVTALMSAGVKAAAFAALIRVFLSLGQALPPHFLLTIFSVLAVLTMVLGNLLALPQRNVKRMLAYSSIAHAGYLLLGIAALFARPETGDYLRFLGTSSFETQQTPELVLRSEILRSILFYLVSYTLTAVGAFGTLAALERREDEDKGFAWDLERLSGLAQRKPGWAIAMAAFMLSLGGIPPAVGFLGKLYVFRSAVDAGLIGLTVIGVLTSVVGAYYYLKVIVHMFMRPSPTGVQVPGTQWSTELALVLASVGVIGFGIIPMPLANWLSKAGSIITSR